jgi:hypothetical protein
MTTPRLDPSEPNKFEPKKYVPPVSDRDKSKKKVKSGGHKPKPPQKSPK